MEDVGSLCPLLCSVSKPSVWGERGNKLAILLSQAAQVPFHRSLSLCLERETLLIPALCWHLVQCPTSTTVCYILGITICGTLHTCKIQLPPRPESLPST